MTLAFLIQMAYGVDSDQIAGKPNWLDSDLYDIVAKPENGVALSREELKPLLQDFLQQRFHLVIHHQTRLVPGYALLVAKGGPRLQPTQGGHPPGFRLYVGPGKLQGINWSMPYLAAMLQRPAGLPVINQTTVKGSYDITLEFAPDIESDSSLPTIFTALRETLGLELKAGKVPVDVVVIDSLDRTPTEN